MKKKITSDDIYVKQIFNHGEHNKLVPGEFIVAVVPNAVCTCNTNTVNTN